MPEAALVAAPIRDALSRATARLAAAGCETPRLDAEVLLAFALGVRRERLVMDATAGLDEVALSRFRALVGRRAAREPVAYIVGAREFRRISVVVDRRVLIPRPESELLVEVGLSLPSGARVVDVGTGSGAVALALKDERPDLEVLGSDVDAGALVVAAGNAQRLGLAVRFLRADLLAGVPGRVDAVLANLPYVAEGSELAPEIAFYEPRGALFAGPDGLACIRRLVPMLGEVPVAALEIAHDQADAVASLMLGAGFHSMERSRDLAGHERVLVARR